MPDTDSTSMPRSPQEEARPPLSSRQLEILRHALRLVRESGLGELTIKRIAREVGFSEPALYRHFPSKSDLVLGLMDQLEDMLLGPIREIAADSTLSIVDRLERIVRHHTSIVLEHNSLPILLLAEAATSSDELLLARIRRILQSYLEILEDLVRAGRGDGEVALHPQPDCQALLLLGMPAALAIRHRLLPDRAAEERFQKDLIPFLMTVIAAAGEPEHAK